MGWIQLDQIKAQRYGVEEWAGFRQFRARFKCIRLGCRGWTRFMDFPMGLKVGRGGVGWIQMDEIKAPK
jgi:hypothetical protein